MNSGKLTPAQGHPFNYSSEWDDDFPRILSKSCERDATPHSSPGRVRGRARRLPDKIQRSQQQPLGLALGSGKSRQVVDNLSGFPFVAAI